jgi:hypothetical protein
MPYVLKPLGERFERLYIPEPNSGCWLWLGDVDRKGYGEINLGTGVSGKRKRRAAHIVGYNLYRGPVLTGFELDHLCRNLLCVNPDHLEAVTHEENVRRGMSPGAIVARTNICMAGHEMTEANTYWSRGQRWCKECRRRRDRKRKRK